MENVLESVAAACSLEAAGLPRAQSETVPESVRQAPTRQAANLSTKDHVIITVATSKSDVSPAL